MVFQRDKARPIGDGKRTGHNDACCLQETIVNPSAEIAALITCSPLESVGPSTPGTDLSDRTPCLRPEDMWKGFRQQQASAHDQRFCIITFVNPESRERVYTKLHGLPFGVGSVVNQFNRLPMRITAWPQQFTEP
jgi:hypothetical protein